MSFPSHRPNFIPLNFYIWGYVKSLMYKEAAKVEQNCGIKLKVLWKMVTRSDTFTLQINLTFFSTESAALLCIIYWRTPRISQASNLPHLDLMTQM
nr:unnamed protein product [Callosobruchus analis]